MGLFSGRKAYGTLCVEELIDSRSDPSEDMAKILELIEYIQSDRSGNVVQVSSAIHDRLKHGSQAQQFHALIVLKLIIDNGNEHTSAIVDAPLKRMLMRMAEIGRTRPERLAQHILAQWAEGTDPRLNSLAPRVGNRSEAIRLGRSLNNGVDGAGAENCGRRSVYRERSRGRRSTSRDRSESPSASPPPLNLRSMSIAATISTSHTVATRLANGIITNATPLRSREVRGFYRQAKDLRNRVLKLISDESQDVQQYLDELLRTNEELIESINAFDNLEDGSPEREASPFPASRVSHESPKQSAADNPFGDDFEEPLPGESGW